MSVGEFASFYLALPPDKYVDYNRALAFAETTIQGACCRLVCGDCEELGEPFARIDGLFHKRNGKQYRCLAEAIRFKMMSNE